MKRIVSALIGAATVFAACAAGAVEVFRDDFDGENGGATAYAYDAFTNWDVWTGPMDLIRIPDEGVAGAPGFGAGTVLDLDATGGEDRLHSKQWFAFGPGSIVTMSFDISGSQRGQPTDIDAWQIGFLFDSPQDLADARVTATNGTNDFYGAFFNIGNLQLRNTTWTSASPWTRYEISFRALESGQLKLILSSPFTQVDGAGALVDNVALSVAPVPEAGTWALMIAGFGLAGAALRRRPARPDPRSA